MKNMTCLHLLISEDGQVLGQTSTHDNAVRQTMVAKGRMFAVSDAEDLAGLPQSAFLPIMDDYCYGGDAWRVDDLSDAAIKKCWRNLKKQNFPYWGKVSVQKVIRNMYLTNGAAYTKDELMEIIPGATWTSITTAFSMLKNKKYSQGELLIIERKVDTGQYTRMP
jgi:hypothetical protein